MTTTEPTTPAPKRDGRKSQAARERARKASQASPWRKGRHAAPKRQKGIQ